MSGCGQRRAPVQKYHAKTIPWKVHGLAWEAYAKKYGTQQSPERMAERGGFGIYEMDMFLPGWREMAEAIDNEQATVDALHAQLEAAEAAAACAEDHAREWKHHCETATARAEAAEAECALIADELVHVRDSWVVPTAGKPSSRRIATINEAGTMRSEDDFDNEVWARRKCATDLDKIIHRLDAARTKEETK